MTDKHKECIEGLKTIRRKLEMMDKTFPLSITEKDFNIITYALTILEKVDEEKILDIIMNHEVIKSLHTLKKPKISNKLQRELLKEDLKDSAHAIYQSITSEKE